MGRIAQFSDKDIYDSRLDLFYRDLEVLHGRKFSLVLNRDQATQAAYLKASKSPCFFCGGTEIDKVGKLEMPESLQKFGYFLLYPVCKPCFAVGNVRQRALRMLEIDNAP